MELNDAGSLAMELASAAVLMKNAFGDDVDTLAGGILALVSRVAREESKTAADLGEDVLATIYVAALTFAKQVLEAIDEVVLSAAEEFIRTLVKIVGL